jgi:formate/nitrite transporter FocA (FNT family)
MSEGGLAEEPVEVFRRSVEHGVMRLERSWSGLFATGTVGGLDVGAGVLALLIVEQRTGSELLGALAFGIGFLALTLAGSELFTENFLVPVSTVVAKDAPWWSVLRLWIGTLVFNLVGGWISMGLAVVAMPELDPTARRIAGDVVSKGATWSTFASAVLAGAAITLMTWMERSTDSVPVKVVAAWSIAFLLAAAPLRHAIVVSIEAFAALHAGASFGYADWLGTLGWAALGNIVGGLGLVTLLRLIQVGPTELRRERARAHPRAEERAPEA